MRPYTELFDDAVAVTLIVFGWLSVLIAVYGAIVYPPPETATFRQSCGISPEMRSKINDLDLFSTVFPGYCDKSLIVIALDYINQFENGFYSTIEKSSDIVTIMDNRLL